MISKCFLLFIVFPTFITIDPTTAMAFQTVDSKVVFGREVFPQAVHWVYRVIRYLQIRYTYTHGSYDRPHFTYHLTVITIQVERRIPRYAAVIFS